MPDKHKYYLLDEDDKYLYLSPTGEVLTSIEPIALPQTPDGWQDINIAWERDKVKHGIIRNFSIALGFVLDGAKIIKSKFYGGNIEKQIFLLITRTDAHLDSTNYGFTDTPIYKGELDLSTFKDESPKVLVSIVEGTLYKLLKANEATVYELPFDEHALRVKLDGIFLYQTNTFLIHGQTAQQHHQMSVSQVSTEGQAAGFAGFSVYYNDHPSSDYTTSPDYLFTTTTANIQMQMKGSVSFAQFVLDDIGTYNLFLKTSTGRTINILTNVPVTYSTNPTLDYDVTFTGSENEKFFLLAEMNGTIFKYVESQFTIKFKSRAKSTFVKCLTANTVFVKLSEKIFNEPHLAQSDLLLIENENLFVTCGDAVRGIEGAKIKTSLNQFFDAFNAILFAGMSIENGKLLLEERARYYNTTDPIHLGKIKNFKNNVATDHIANTFKIGYPAQNTDDVNGKYAFNNSYTYSSLITKVVKEHQVICPYITDPYAIELFRINLEGKTTTDNSSDNQVMILNVDLANPIRDAIGVYYNLKRVAYDSSEGLPDINSAFNIEQLTPKRMAEQHQWWINSMNNGFAGEDLTFNTTEKNADLKTVLGADVYDENANIEIGLTKLFLPWYFDFDTEVPIDLPATKNLYPNKAFSFEHKDEILIGFPMRDGIAPDDNKEQSFRLLSGPDNDMTLFI